MGRIEMLTGVRLSGERTRIVLRRLGLRYRRTAQIPGKADPQLQFEFPENELQPRLEEAGRGERRVFFVDAAHFVLGCFTGMIWCMKRLFTRGASGRQRYNILGALDSHSKEVVTVRSKSNVNAQTVMELLDLLRGKHPGGKLTLVLDNARYQRAKLVTAKAAELDIELLFLPPYSPNLNIIERLWKLVQSRCQRNRFFPDFALFKDAIDTFLDRLHEDFQEELQSLLTLHFQTFGES
jgi:transposase